MINRITKTLITILFFGMFFNLAVSAFERPQLIPVNKPSDGNIYYIDAKAPPGGNGLTQSTAWDSIEDADGVVGPSAIVKIKAGTYPELIWNSSSGTSGKEIVIQPYGDGMVYIEGANRIESRYIIIDGGEDQLITFRRSSGDTIILGLYGDYITLCGIVIEGPSGDCGNTNNTGIGVGSPTYQGTTTDFYEILSPKIYNVTFKDLNHKGIYYHAAKNGELRNNIFQDIEGNSIQLNPRGGHYIDGLIIDGNAIFNNGPCVFLANGIGVFGMSSSQGTNPYMRNIIISNNYIWNNSDEHGLKIDSPFLNSSGNHNALQIHNNTIFGMAQYGIRVSSGTVDNEVIIKNNLFSNNGSGGIYVHSGVSLVQHNNLTSNPSSSFASTDVNSDNYLKLSPMSEAINQGADLREVIQNDYFGNLRPQNEEFDIGAHEYTDGSSVTNLRPESAINTPTGDITINAGDAVDFSGTGSDPDNNLPMTYLWQFGTGSGLANSTNKDPGLMQFSTPGTYTVSFTVTDSLGLADATPATRTITVQSTANQPPNGTITSPSGSVTIDVGETVNFSATATDADNDLPLSFLWQFGSGSGISNMTVASPGPVQFNTAGTFNVTFHVTDSKGNVDPSPATVTVTVQNTAIPLPTMTITPSDSYTKIESAQAGDVVEIAPGTYRYRVYLTNSGTATNPIIIRAQDPNNRPVWDLSGDIARNFPGSYTGGDLYRGIWQVSGNYIEIDGIEFKNGHDDSNCAGIRPKGSTPLTVRNCHFEGNDNGITGWGTVTFEHCTVYANGDPGPGDGTHNVYSEGGYYTFRFCRIWDPIEGQNIHSRSLDMKLEYCSIENAGSYMGGIMDYRLDGTSGLTFSQTLTLKGNIIIQTREALNDAQVFVMYYDGNRTNSIDMRINMYYNTFVGFGDNAALIHATDSSIHGQSAYLYNNIFYGNHRPFRLDTTNNVHMESRNNWWPDGYDYSSYSAYMSDSHFGASPGFVDPSHGDYSLTASSDLINSANTSICELPVFQLSSSHENLNYIQRASAFDLGAIETTEAEPDSIPPSRPSPPIGIPVHK